MNPREYILPFIERTYVAEHPELTPAARALVREDVQHNPDKYAVDEHALALVAYARTRSYLLSELNKLEDMPDDEFERERERLFDEARLALFKITETDRMCIDAQLLGVILSNTGVDACLSDLMKLEAQVRDYLKTNVSNFDENAEHYWRTSALGEGVTAAALTVSEPTMIGWLHTLEALAQLCLASARYQAAIAYSDQVLRAEGYPNRSVGTKLLALARLEDEDAFFATSSALDSDSPWYLLARTILFYKIGREKPARRALRDFASRCDGGAFFLLNPTYLTPYLPDRPEPRESWDLAHQAVWEADGILMDTPDFPAWAEKVEGIAEASETFARRYGF